MQENHHELLLFFNTVDMLIKVFINYKRDSRLINVMKKKRDDEWMERTREPMSHHKNRRTNPRHNMHI